MMEGVRIRSYLRVLFSVKISFALSYGSEMKRGVGDRRDGVGIIGDCRTMR